METTEVFDTTLDLVAKRAEDDSSFEQEVSRLNIFFFFQFFKKIFFFLNLILVMKDKVLKDIFFYKYKLYIHMFYVDPSQ